MLGLYRKIAGEYLPGNGAARKADRLLCMPSKDEMAQRTTWVEAQTRSTTGNAGRDKVALQQ